MEVYILCYIREIDDAGVSCLNRLLLLLSSGLRNRASGDFQIVFDMFKVPLARICWKIAEIMNSATGP